MEEKGFATAAFFLVTGVSFLGFSKIILLLDGENLPLFTWLGVLFLLVGGFLAIRFQKQDTRSNS